MIFIIITIGLFILELCIKNHIVKTKLLNEEVPIIKDKLAIQYTQNKGAFYSTFEDKSKVICGLSSGFLALLCIIYSALLTKKGNNITKLGLSLVISGGLSNVYDRIKRKHVVDYIYWNKLKKIVFNLADVFIFIGGLITIIGELIKDK